MLGSLQDFWFWSAVTDRMALGLRSVRCISGRFQQRSVADRNLSSIRSARAAYGPQELRLTVRKPVAGSRKWTAACSASCTAFHEWFSKSGTC
ncbi:hypothetical protein HanXRQr2_Chr13g0571911 [Helianthus annuus]|uniref:Uncharacterized protein n=1 Tax=Helianthus annuus TaxID=4232 RepID=A0A9K3EEP9_HELAN|nr:hypothetical protein HanXRQr2_Chr13g0571911 [Helianthus annuus]KAJ0847885.1 hypothetical protein HanPSC8_Chr13g0550581 [Helianthus annuus]